MVPCRHWSCINRRPHTTTSSRLYCAVCKATPTHSICLWCGKGHCEQHHRGHGRLASHHLSIVCGDGAVWCGKCVGRVECGKEKVVGMLQEWRDYLAADSGDQQLLPQAEPDMPLAETEQTQTKQTLRPSTRGLINLGNTCFLNSVLQCLAHTITQLPPPGNDTEAALFDCLANLKSTTHKGPVNPGNLLAILAQHHKEFRRRRQQDAHDLLCKLFAQCRPDFVADRFGLGLQWTVRCGGCGGESVTVERTSFLSLPIAVVRCDSVNDSDHLEDVVERMRSLKLKKSGVKTLKVSHLIEQYFSKQSPLTQDNQYHCDRCNRKQDGTQSLSLHSTTTTTIIHLQRYTADCRKDGRPVHADPVLLLGGRVYRLRAAVVHCGGTLESGHYVALLCGEGGEVVRASDLHVGPGDVDELVDSYLLYYTLIPST